MIDTSTDDVAVSLAAANNTLSQLTQAVTRRAGFHATLNYLMQSNHSIVSAFEDLADEHPELANDVLLSAVSALVTLHRAESLAARLHRRCECN